jgi:hypothetical protein
MLAGCGQGSDTRQSRDANRQEPRNAREESSEARPATTISVGDTLSSALASLRDQGLRYEDANMATSLPMYQVFPKYETPDALFLTIEEPGGNDSRIEGIFWWIDFEHDAKLPKGERKSEERHVRSINLSDLDPANPQATTDAAQSS